MPSYKFIYFDGRGAGERVRWLFKIAKVDFEDVRYSFDEMKKAQAEGKFVVALDKLPILEVDGVQIPQSKAMERFLAKQVGLMGANPMEEAQIDALCEHQRDLRDVYKKADDMPKGEEQTKKYEEALNDLMPKFVGKVEAALTGRGPYLAGDKLTLADVAWAQFLCDYLDGGGWDGEKDAVTNILSKNPRMKSAIDGVLANPEVAAWLKERPKGIF